MSSSAQQIMDALGLAKGIAAAHANGITWKGGISGRYVDISVNGKMMLRIPDGKGFERTYANYAPQSKVNHDDMIYMSPDTIMATSSDSIDHEKVDMYGYGCFLYELFFGETMKKAIIRYYRTTNIRPLLLHCILHKGLSSVLFPVEHTVPAAIAQLIKNCLKINPKERPTASELVASLREYGYGATRCVIMWMPMICRKVVLIRHLDMFDGKPDPIYTATVWRKDTGVESIVRIDESALDLNTRDNAIMWWASGNMFNTVIEMDKHGIVMDKVFGVYDTSEENDMWSDIPKCPMEIDTMFLNKRGYMPTEKSVFIDKARQAELLGEWALPQQNDDEADYYDDSTADCSHITHA